MASDLSSGFSDSVDSFSSSTSCPSEQTNDNNCTKETAELRLKIVDHMVHKYKAVDQPESKDTSLKYYPSAFTKGFQHNKETGLLDTPVEYKKYLKALEKGDYRLLDKLNLGKPLVDPFASLNLELVGRPQCSIKLPKPPKISSAQLAGELLVDYAHQLTIDLPFVDWSDEELKPILTALTNSKNYPGPVPLTANNLFRHKEEVGPFVSQLFYLGFNNGSLRTEQKYMLAPAGSPFYGTTKEEMINIQNGQYPPNKTQVGPNPLYIHSQRGLATIVHTDPPCQFGLQAAFVLNSLNAKANPGWIKHKNSARFINGGFSDLVTLLGMGCDIPLEHAWYQKWQIYRSLRPEAFSLLVQNVKDGTQANNPFNLSNVVLKSPLLDLVKEKFGSYLLPLQYPEGSPLHPSYPAGHATIAGFLRLILLCYYDGAQKWSDLNKTVVQSSADGTTLIPFNGQNLDQMTVESELSKYAWNISSARDMAGVHFWSDCYYGILLGEKAAVAVMRDRLAQFKEDIILKVTGFDGKEIIITKSTELD